MIKTESDHVHNRDLLLLLYTTSFHAMGGIVMLLLVH